MKFKLESAINIIYETEDGLSSEGRPYKFEPYEKYGFYLEERKEEPWELRGNPREFYLNPPEKPIEINNLEELEAISSEFRAPLVLNFNEEKEITIYDNCLD